MAFEPRSPTFAKYGGERQPLLDYKQNEETVVGIAGSLEIPDEAEPHVVEELKTLLKLVYPVVVTTALEFLPGFTCIILAGHIKSPHTQQYVDAATLSTMFINITAYSVGFGLTSALDTLCSQAYGARRFEKIGIYFQAGLQIILACLGPIFLLNWYSESFLLYMGQDPEVSRLAQSFSRWMLPGVPFVFLYELVRKVLQAQNIMKPLVGIAAMGNVVNIATGYVLTYHTSMGFEGIALSRSLGNMVLPLLLIPYFYYHPHHLTQWWRGWNMKEAFAHVGLFLRLGVPGALMMTMGWWAFELLTLMAGVLPNAVVSVSAHAVLVNINNTIYMTFAGLAVASNIRVGNCLGANAPKQAKLACTVSLLLTLGISSTFSITLYMLRGSIPSLFLNDPQGIARAASVLAVWAPLEVLDGLNAVIQGIFRGAGKQKVAATVNAVAYYIFGIPVAGLLAFHFVLGVEGLWLGFGFGIFVAASLQFYMLFERWTWAKLADEAQKRTE
ncbi:Multidrug/Oligosaccharidyl-lipid/Polysaccharide (MOP) Flippase Superfamily [Phytophthora cinnamomi]|uniref:Multidrug/Oligosaccharidyl-lipid/Polysaccharide (MOP) Flippase Superfamily n=1 Tax=Phytophthora cinnamomi TaxID=4785 RepID=UPI00355A6C3D|nr:Multidrug/Oligosaccharidyl-lipid/Polysaccharide (MOP) Flippase Superfamily [Phytophthora cinnamomi]